MSVVDKLCPFSVTEPPVTKAEEINVVIPVPAIAANSEVGFKDSLGSIDEG